MLIEKLVLAFMNLTSWSKLVGRVRQLERQTVVFVAQEYQATVVSFTKPVYCFCKRIYQSVGLSSVD